MVEARKNVSRIAQAYRASEVSLPLVVAGPDGWAAAPIAAVLRDTPGGGSAAVPEPGGDAVVVG